MSKQMKKTIFGILGGIVLMLLIAYLPPETEMMSRQGWQYLGCFGFLLTCLISGALPDWVATLATMVMLLVFKLGKVADVTVEFSGTTVWLCIGVFIMSVGINNSGFMKRLALWVLTKFPGTYRGQVTAMMLAGIITTPMIPSSYAKTSIMAPLIGQVCEAVGAEPNSKAARGLWFANFMGTYILGIAFMSGSAFVALMIGFMQGLAFTWGSWLKCTIVWYLVLIVLTYLYCTIICKPKEKLAGDVTFLKEQYKALGAISKKEKPEWGAELERLCADSVRLIRLEPVDGRSALCALVSGEPDTLPDVPVSRDDVACRLHTSGTTGEPKCVVYTHGGMLREIVSMLQVYPYPDGQRYQFIAQLFHSAAIGAHLSLATGGTMVLKDHFALEDYMHTLVSERIESISVVPTVLKWILDETDNGDYDLSHLKTVNYSTCPIPKALLQRAIEKLHCSFYQSYGMTEMGSTVTALLPEDHLRDGGKYLSSVGRPIPGAAVRIVAPDGSDCPAGTAGEIYVRGPGRMLEYLDAPETTHAALVGGWYRTKDMGMLDAQGYLFLSGRADDLIISGGENIYPGEVTNVIMQLCDDVAEVAVYGVPDETWGEHVKASVVLMPGSRLTAEALRQYCRAHMPTFRAPKEIEIVPELPKGATGKVLTAVLRARSVQAS